MSVMIFFASDHINELKQSTPCIPLSFPPNSFQEGWRGHFSRQPGQVRKEAAPTSFDMGRCQPSAMLLQ